MRIIRIDPGAEPEIVEINNSRQAMQAVVGGNIEQIFATSAHVGRWLNFFCNEDPAGLRPNRNVSVDPELGRTNIRGPILVSATDDEGNTVSLTDAEIMLALRNVERWTKITTEGPTAVN